PRRVVPLDLRDRLGGLTEVRHSRWKIESIKVDRLFEQARRGGAVMPTGLRRITEDERDYHFDKLVADDQRERRLPDHVRRRYMAHMQDDGSRRCSEVLERWVRDWTAGHPHSSPPANCWLPKLGLYKGYQGARLEHSRDGPQVTR